jgi:hypothetical protein
MFFYELYMEDVDGTLIDVPVLMRHYVDSIFNYFLNLSFRKLIKTKLRIP